MPKPASKDVAEGFEVLSDEQRRAEYDQMWQHRNDPQFNRQFHHGDGQSFNAEDLTISSRQFSVNMPPEPSTPATRGHDIEIEVAVFLEETLTPSISVPSAITCRFITPLA